MDLSRMYRIAETGDVNDPTPVDNVLRMAEERQRQQQQARPQSAWGRFKNFAGSDSGRTLWGGLGTALGVGLTGGNLQDALGYGVIGAGNTVGTLNQNRQYANRLALKQQERADALAKEQRDNRFRLGLQDRALAQSKQLADYQLDKTLARLRGEQEIKDTAEKAARQRKIDAINNNPYLTEDQKQWQIARLDGLNFDRSAYYTDALARDPNNQEALDYFGNQATINNLINPVNYTETVLKNADKFTPESYGNFSRSGDVAQLVPNKKYASGDLGLVQMMVEEGKSFDEALDRVSKMTPEQKIAFEGKKAGAIKGAELPSTIASQNNQAKNTLEHDKTMAGINYGYDQLAADNQMHRDIEIARFKDSLPTETQKNITAQSQATGIPESVIYRVGLEKQIADARQIWANVAKTVADTQKVNRELSQPQLSPAEEARAKEEAKLQAQDEHEKEKAARQKKAMLPTVKYAINRAKDALKEGTGLGQIGGWGWTTGQGGRNRADIQNAKAQMNIFMRSLLKEMGVGSKEMDAATEAVAYRYEIDPMMPEEQISRVLDNFMEDYANGTLEKNLSTEAQKHAGNGGGSQVDTGNFQTKFRQMMAPNGKIVNVPESEVENALKQGGRLI
mgnify:CR=1 FL=1